MGLGLPIVRDFIILILVGIFTLCNQLDWFVGDNLHNRGWFVGDHSIGLPIQHKETFPAAIAAVFAFGMPVVVLILTWFFVDKIHSSTFDNNTIEQCNDIELITGVPLLAQGTVVTSGQIENPFSNGFSQPEGSNGQPPFASSARQQPLHQLQADTVFNWGQQVSPTSTPRSRKCRFALYQFFVLCLMMCFCIIVTVSIKLMVGRLRPDFLSRCKPDYTLLSPGQIDPETNYVAGEYSWICQGDKAEIIEGRKSFPSQHSSTAFMGGVFTMLVLFKRCWNRASRSPFGFIIIPFLMMAAFGGALVISASRHFDHRHFFGDIVIGAIIGILSALFSLAFDMWTPTWERDGSMNKKFELRPIDV